jgi:hypothetical protein
LNLRERAFLAPTNQGFKPGTADIRLNLGHLGRADLQQPRRLAHSTPLVEGSTDAADRVGVVRGRLRRLPDALALFDRGIIARSNSLNAPNMPNSVRPVGVDVSSACWYTKSGLIDHIISGRWSRRRCA